MLQTTATPDGRSEKTMATSPELKTICATSVAVSPVSRSLFTTAEATLRHVANGRWIAEGIIQLRCPGAKLVCVKSWAPTLGEFGLEWPLLLIDRGSERLTMAPIWPLKSRRWPRQTRVNSTKTTPTDKR